jgi:hypothetical protein
MPRLAFVPTTLFALTALCSAAQAQQVMVTATVTNLTPANSISFAPLHVGFGNGSFDAFNIGQAPGDAIVSVAEGGAGVIWQSAFAAAEPGAVRGTIGGLRLPGSSASMSFLVDSGANPYFTFAAMAVPSNDFFIGNDNPMAYRLFDPAGQLQISSITLQANEVWDAGSEVFDPMAAAFVGNNDLRTPQQSVVALNFAEFFGFNGLGTGAGYVFDSQLSAHSDVYRISFEVSAVPEPGTYGLLSAGGLVLALVARRRRHTA